MENIVPITSVATFLQASIEKIREGLAQTRKSGTLVGMPPEIQVDMIIVNSWQDADYEVSITDALTENGTQGGTTTDEKTGSRTVTEITEGTDTDTPQGPDIAVEGGTTTDTPQGQDIAVEGGTTTDTPQGQDIAVEGGTTTDTPQGQDVAVEGGTTTDTPQGSDLVIEQDNDFSFTNYMGESQETKNYTE